MSEYLNYNQIIDAAIQATSNKEMASILIQSLGLKKTRAYDVVSKRSALSYDETIQLINHPLLSDTFPPLSQLPSDRFQWYYPTWGVKSGSAIYLEHIYKYLQSTTPAETSIKVISHEIPIFYYMYLPELFAFKLFCWSRSVWKSNEFGNQFDEKEILSEEISGLISKIKDKYFTLASEEIWSLSLFDNTISQIIYFKDCEKFKFITQVFKLKKSLLKLVDILEQISLTENKFIEYPQLTGGKCRILRNDIYYTSNIYLVENKAKHVVFLSLDNPNFMISDDIKAIQVLSAWFQNMQIDCTPLTGNNEVVRNNFFNRLRDRIEKIE